MDALFDYIRAFCVGGILCVIAQVLIDKTSLTPARILVLYVCSGVALGAVGAYEPLVNFAGRGATVPLTGFGYLIYQGVKKAVDANGFLGIFTGALSAAAGGISASVIFALAAALIFKSKPKK